MLSGWGEASLAPQSLAILGFSQASRSQWPLLLFGSGHSLTLSLAGPADIIFLDKWVV